MVSTAPSHAAYGSAGRSPARRISRPQMGIFSLSRDLRTALLDLRDQRLVSAFARGEQSIAESLVFPSQSGTVLNMNNFIKRTFVPLVQRAGQRKMRFHDLRHRFGRLLIQQVASLAYVKEQMGHSSIQVTVDTYGHLIPGGNIAWVDALDAKPSQQKNATPAQQRKERQVIDMPHLIENNGRPGEIRTPDPWFRKPFWSCFPASDQQVTVALSWADPRCYMTFAPLFAPPRRVVLSDIERNVGDRELKA